MAAVAAAGGVVAGPGAAAAGAGAGAEGGVTGVGSSSSVAFVSADVFFATGGDVDGGAAFLAVGGDVAAGVPFGGGVSDGIKRSAILDSEDFTPLGEGCSAEVGLSPSSFFELRRKENILDLPG